MISSNSFGRLHVSQGTKSQHPSESSNARPAALSSTAYHKAIKASDRPVALPIVPGGDSEPAGATIPRSFPSYHEAHQKASEGLNRPVSQDKAHLRVAHLIGEDGDAVDRPTRLEVQLEFLRRA